MRILNIIVFLIVIGLNNFSFAKEINDKGTNMTKPKLLFIAGSIRKDSVNKKLAFNAYQLAVKMGADCTFIDLKDYPLPLYDGDLEAQEGLPANAKKLKSIFIQHDGVFLASPEHNSSITSLLKNTLDWISRSEEKGETPNKAYANKVFALSSASPGYLGGQRALIPLQMMLSNVGVIVLPKKVSIAKAYDKFDEKGNLSSSEHLEDLRLLVKDFIRVTTAIKQCSKHEAVE